MAGISGSYLVLGHEADIKIDNTLFGVRSGNARLNVDPQEGGDTNTGGVKIHKGGRASFSGTLDFYTKSDQNPFGAPYSLLPGTYVKIKIYPQGVTVNNPIETDYFLVNDADINFDVDGKGTGRISGISSGSFIWMGTIYS